MLQKKLSTTLQRRAKKSDSSRFTSTDLGYLQNSLKSSLKQLKRLQFSTAQRNRALWVNHSSWMLQQLSAKQVLTMLFFLADAMVLVQKTHLQAQYSLFTQNLLKKILNHALLSELLMMLQISLFQKLNRLQSHLLKVQLNVNSGVSAVTVL